MSAADPERSAATPRGRGDGVRAELLRAGSSHHEPCFHAGTRRSTGNLGPANGQEMSSLELQLRRMKQARQPRPPKAPQAQKKGLPKLERMDTSDSLTEMDTRNSFTTTTKPLSTPHPGSKTRNKGRKTAAAAAAAEAGGRARREVPPR